MLPAAPFAQTEATENRDLASRGEEGNKEHWTAPASADAHDPRGLKSWVTCAAQIPLPASSSPLTHAHMNA